MRIRIFGALACNKSCPPSVAATAKRELARNIDPTENKADDKSESSNDHLRSCTVKDDPMVDQYGSALRI
jgi:hypothetical protein